MQYEGTTCPTALSRISLPAWYRILVCHPWIILLSLSLRNTKISLLLSPTSESSPRYLSVLSGAVMPRIFDMRVLSSCETFLLKKNS